MPDASHILSCLDPRQLPAAVCRLCQLWREPNFRSDPDYIAAVDWYNGIELPEKSYDLTLEVARAKYAEVNEAVDTLDGKADALFRFSATVAGVAIAGAKFVELHWLTHLIVVSSLVLLGVSISLTLRARKSVEKDAPMAVPALFELSVSSDQAKGRLAAGLHCNIVAIRAVLNWKAKLFDYATNLAIGGIILLLLAIAVSAATPNAQSNDEGLKAMVANPAPS